VNRDQLGVSHSARVTLMVFAGVAMFIVFILMILTKVHSDATAFKAATPVFIEIMLFGSLLGLSSIFALSIQTDAACRAFPFVLGVAFVTMMGALYVKTWRLMIIFSAKQMKIISISLSEMAVYLAILVAIEVGFNVAWLISAAPHLNVISGSPSPLSYQECGGTDFDLWQVASFAYKAIFLFYGIFLAVMTRGLPVVFNESAWIGISIYNVTFSVVIVLPVVYGGKTQDNLTAIFVITCGHHLGNPLHVFCIGVSEGLSNILRLERWFDGGCSARDCPYSGTAERLQGKFNDDATWTIGQV